MAGGFGKYNHDLMSGSSGAVSPSKEYTVGAGHGFSAMDLVSIADGPVFTKAIATSSGALAEGVVISTTATQITIGFDGVHTVTSHGKTVGSWYYLSQSVSGGGGAIPATGWQQRVYFVIDADTILVRCELGIFA